MPSPRALPAYYGFLQAGTRSLSWATALVAVLLLAYVGRTWPDKGQVIVAGIMGSAVAMLNDSWDAIAITDAWQTLPRLTSSRRVLHDLFSFALSVGGMIMMWVSNLRLDSNTPSFESRREQRYVMAALWGLLAQVAWRVIHVVWGCIDCSRDARAAAERRRRRRRRRRRHHRDRPIDPWFEITGYRV